MKNKSGLNRLREVCNGTIVRYAFGYSIKELESSF